jgi:hypothetical protein
MPRQGNFKSFPAVGGHGGRVGAFFLFCLADQPKINAAFSAIVIR